MAPTGNSLGAMIVRASVSATITNTAPPSAAAGMLMRLSLPSDRRARCGTTNPTYPTDPLAATELPTNKLATTNTTTRTRPTSTPRSNAPRSPSINKFNERAFSVSINAPAITVAIAGALILTLNARSLNLLMLGERGAFDLGVEVGRVRVVVFVVASLLVGSSVAASGSVGYVGLVVPHLARLSLGSDNRISIPAAALGGAVFVIVADTLARTIIAPRELPVGAITALIGAPLFIYLLKRA